MKRTAFDERRDQQIASDYTASHMACSFCKSLTEVSELSTYGSRCFACYRSYCDQDRHFEGLSIAQRKEMAGRVKLALAGGLRASPRDHIAYLEAKEAAGTATTAQRGFLSAVRKASTSEAAA